MRYWTNKKLIFVILALVFVGLVGLTASDVAALELQPPGALGPAAAAGPAAAGAVAASAPSSFRGQATLNKAAGLGFDTTTTILAILGFLSILQAVLTTLLALVSFFLNNLFAYNTTLLPNAMPVVYSGWTAMRDIANAIFILILLWIAFAIIFNIEKLGGKQLLARLIVVAFLINFSLAMVSLIFGFANALAKPFQKAINTADIAGLIVGKTNLHNITSQLTNTETVSLEAYGINQEEIETLQRETDRARSGGGQLDRLDNFLPFAVGPGEVKAEGAAAAAVSGCGVGALLGSIIPIPGVAQAGGCVTGAIIGAIAKAAGSWALAVGVTALSWKAILNLAVSNLFLILTIFALVTAGILLLGRIIAMVFVAVLAPTAFLAYTIPGKFGQKYWDMWLDNLLKWSFIAPAFYFLFWISLLVLDKMQSTIPQTGQFQGNTLYIFTLVVFLGFLFASINIAKKMGITVADSFIKWGQKAGWATLGLAGAGIGGIASRAATAVISQPRIQKTLGGIAKTPGLRWAGGAYPQRASVKFLEAQRAKIKKEEGRITSFNREQTISDYAASFSPERKVALMQKIVSEGWLKQFQEEYGPQEIETALNLSARYGMQKPLLELRPNLITDANASTYVSGAKNRREAIDRIIKTLPDKTKISPESANDPEVLRAILLNVKGQRDLDRIARENTYLFQNLFQYYQNNKDGLEKGLKEMNDKETPNAAPGTGRGDRQKEILEYMDTSPGRILFAGQKRPPAQRPGQQPNQGPAESDLINAIEEEERERQEREKEEREKMPPA